MAVQIIQVKRSNGETDRYPWPQMAGNLQSAKGQIDRWVKKVAQHWHMETPPKFEWHAKRSTELTFGHGESAVTYRFELEEPR